MGHLTVKLFLKELAIFASRQFLPICRKKLLDKGRPHKIVPAETSSKKLLTSRYINQGISKTVDLWSGARLPEVAEV